jgi:SAM-dependent methyltransferase
MKWSKIARARALQEGRFPTVLKLPLIYNLHESILDLCPAGGRVLDIGAHDRSMEARLKKKDPTITYKSMDVDKSHPHDYYTLDEIGEAFDCIYCLSVIEHMPFADGFGLIANAYRLTAPGGRLVMLTPNALHPNYFWRDVTHITPWPFNDLAGALLDASYRDVELYRVDDRPKFKDLMRRLRWLGLLKFLKIDFAKHILAVAYRDTET